MFLQEFSPIVQECVQKPVAFLGGFAAGLLRLNLSDDPVKSWLERTIGISGPTTGNGSTDSRSNGSGPQSISID